MKLSQNFTLIEFTKSQAGSRLKIDNTPPPAAIERLKLLCQNVLEPVRQKFGTVTILSGYRAPLLNRKIGGAPNSQHLTGEAADFEVAGISNVDLFCWVKDNVKFDQLILEFHEPSDGPNSGWVHASYAKQLRSSVLVIDRRGTRKWEPKT